jgi:hypothetical protein
MLIQFEHSVEVALSQGNPFKSCPPCILGCLPAVDGGSGDVLETTTDGLKSWVQATPEDRSNPGG